MTHQMFDAERAMRGLTEFQRRSVNHVMDRFYSSRPSRRFLVADETGLGKSIVAKGVIARTIEHLQDDPTVDRIDVVYVCSNTDLARQNLQRLNVTGDKDIAFSSRLTMLAKQGHSLNRGSRAASKPVNLISFTPGTSFERGYRMGEAEERALLLILLWQLCETRDATLPRRRQTAFYRLFQGGVHSWQRFAQVVEDLEREIGDRGPDPRIAGAFAKKVQQKTDGKPGLLGRVDDLLDRLEAGGDHARLRAWHEIGELTRDLRTALAHSSVDSLEPDLIILDEFQRFRGMLDPNTEAGELAHELFGYGEARVLLLSATPFKPFTYGEEAEDHAEDFFTLLNFLANGDDATLDVPAVKKQLQQYRDRLRSGGDVADVRENVGSALRRVMSRWERPSINTHSPLVEHVKETDQITASDLASYVALHRASELVGKPRDRGLVTPEYWKSAPYFASFCQGYQLANRLQENQTGGVAAQLRQALDGAQLISARDVASFAPLEPASARLRMLVQDTLDQEWWRMLWVSPSLPYFTPGGAFASESARSMTKRLLFSSWGATPTAVASVLSYEAERRIAEGTSYASNTPEARRRIPQALTFPVSDDRPRRMSTLLLVWPLTRLAAIADPRRLVRESGGEPVSAADATRQVLEELRRVYGHDLRPGTVTSALAEDEGAMTSGVWQTAFGDGENWFTSPLVGDRITDPVAAALDGISGRQSKDTASSEDEVTTAAEGGESGLERHLRLAAATLTNERAQPSDDDLAVLAQVALFSPGCVSLRVTQRLAASARDAHGTAPSDAAVHQAAATIAGGLRSLFNRPDVTKLLDPTVDQSPYWSHMLQYIAAGNLEAVLDEWLFHLWSDAGAKALDEGGLEKIATAAAAAISLRNVTYQALDFSGADGPIRMNAGFALRYGDRGTTSDGGARQPEVRAAFNSPFWPFVLASTSVGQEGIDFHWWCHAVFHWNTPANPVDFEQREGRVDRFRGHAVRKNVAAAHGAAILRSQAANPWCVAYDHATEYKRQYGDFTPDWVYPGPASIERHVVPLAFSRDRARYERVKRDVSLYRVTLGQPRQEDLVEALRGRELTEAEISDLRIDLTPPAAD